MRSIRVACAAVLIGAVTAVAAPTAAADPGAAGIAGYSTSVQALGVQIGFNIPGIVPLPDENLVEEDVPFARTTVSAGPVVNALGAPYYPGDIAANVGSLLAEFAPAGAPSVPNDPLEAMADYPPDPAHGQDASFGGTPPAGVPIAPNVFSATSHADTGGGHATATLTDLSAAAPTSAQSDLVQLGATPAAPAGPLAGPLGAVLGGAAPGLSVGTIQATNSVVVTASTVTSTAQSVLKAIDVAGVLQISQVTGSSSAESDGTTGTPSASLHLAGVTAEGQPAYIDQQGVHVSGTTPASGGVTPAQAQSALDTTLAQDGITVRLLDPTTSANGAAANSDTGGLVISIAHAFDVPFVPGEPSIPVPGLGNTNLPAGLYNAVTTVTIGSATSSSSATVAVPFADSGALPGLAGPAGPITLGIPALTGTTPLSGAGPGSAGPGSAPGGDEALGAGPPGSGPSSLSGVVHRLPLGIPPPLAWVLAALVLCVLITYPMLLAVRWQFLSARSRG